MQGKTTFILMDKDTGRVVDKREEHNMVTNVIRDIFNEPRIAFFNSGTIFKNLANYLPMYKYLLKGLVLFGDNVPEKNDDYFIDGRYNIVGTAGDAYTGTDAKRGTFNTSQSGVIENGYRFVWDFAPEKAIGTIKCAALSSIYSGNQGGAFSTGSILANGVDISNTSSDRAFATTGSQSGYPIMTFGVYNYNQNVSSNPASVTVYKYKMPNPDALEICSTREIVLEKSFTIPTNWSIRNTFSNANDGKIYWFGVSKLNDKLAPRIGAIDVRTEEHTLVSENFPTDLAYSSYYNKGTYAFFENQLYYGYGSKVYVYNLDGTRARDITLSTSGISNFFLMDGKIGVIATYSPTNTTCYAILGSSITYFPVSNLFKDYTPVANDMLHKPYFAIRSSSAQYIMLRTDYLATINNLTEPLEKTDQHALQVRYEITN